MISAVGSIPATPFPLGFTPQTNGDVKIEGEKFEGYLTLSQSVLINGEKYTVRLYIENDHRPENQILNDQNIKQQMTETIEKMVNISVAYNIGRDSTKKKGNVTGITLARDSKTISQHIDYRKNNKEIDLEATLNSKRKKYEKIKKPENSLLEAKVRQKLHSIDYIQTKVLKQSSSQPETTRDRTVSQAPPPIDPKILEDTRKKASETLSIEPIVPLNSEPNLPDSYFELVEVVDQEPLAEEVKPIDNVQESSHESPQFELEEVGEDNKKSLIPPDKIIPDDFRAFKATEVCGHLLDRLGVAVEKLDKMPASKITTELRGKMEWFASILKEKILEIVDKEDQWKTAHIRRRGDFLKSHLFFPDTYVPMPPKEELEKMEKQEADAFLAAERILKLRIDNRARLLLKNIEQFDKELDS